MTEKEFCKLHTSYYGELIDNPKQIALIQFTGEELKHYVEHFMPLCEVSRSIGLDTENILLELTPKQIKKGMTPCELCKYVKRDYGGEECQRCMQTNGLNQYYG